MEWLNPKEKREAALFRAYLQGRLLLPHVRRRLGLPESTFYRRLKRYREGGARALAHRLRRRPSNRSLRLVRRHLCGLFPVSDCPSALAFFREFVKPVLDVAYSTVRRWLREAGLLRTPPRRWKRRLPTLGPRKQLRNQPPCELDRPSSRLSRRQRQEKKLRRWLRDRYEVFSPRLRRALVAYIQRTHWIPRPWRWNRL